MLIFAWALRLNGFLVARIRKAGQDKRFDSIRSHFFSFLKFWLGKRDLFQTFPDEILTDDEQVRDIHEVRQLLDGTSNTDGEKATTC